MGQRSGGRKPLFFSFDLDEHTPADHLRLEIDQSFDLSDLRRHIASFCSRSGGPKPAGQVAKAATPLWVKFPRPP